MKKPNLNKYNPMRVRGTKKISSPMRVFLLLFGLILASSLIVFAVSWDNLPVSLSLIGIQANRWVIAFVMVLIGLLASSMIKSGLLGTYRLD